MGGIVESPMITIYLSGKHRADLIRVAADGDDRFHRLIQKCVEMFGMMSGEIDADFLHRPDGKRMHVSGRFGTGAGHADHIAGRRAKNSFGEMAAARIAGAKNQNERFFHGARLSAATGAIFPRQANVLRKAIRVL